MLSSHRYKQAIILQFSTQHAIWYLSREYNLYKDNNKDTKRNFQNCFFMQGCFTEQEVLLNRIEDEYMSYGSNLVINNCL